MRVLHLLSSNRYSGAENVVCQIVHMFRNDKEYEMLYCSPDGPIREALKERDVAFVPLKATSLFEFRMVIRKTKPDIVHAHDMKASFLAALTCGKIPLISHIHNNSFESRKLTFKTFLYTFAACRARHIFWVSKAAYNGYALQNVFKNKSSILCNLIDPQQLIEKASSAECNDAYDIVFIGRMSYPKNPQRLIKVLSMVAEKLPSMKAAIIGSGEMDEEVKALIVEKNLQDNIDFKGFMSNPYGILKNSKVMIMTSRWEGMPMCALEATALGVPIVATPTDGLNELIINGKNGFLSNDDEKLVENICLIVSEQDRLKELCLNQLERSSEVNNAIDYEMKVEEVYKNSL